MLNVKKTLTKLMGRTGCEYFTLTGYAGFDEAFGYGFCDKSTNTVRLYLYGKDSANLTSSIVLFTVPSAYRPPQNIAAPMVFATDSTNGITNYATVYANGEVKQAISNYMRSFVAFCEYQLGGVIRTLKNAISNLYREEVAVC